MRRLALLAIVTLACAPSHSPAPTTGTQTVRVSGVGGMPGAGGQRPMITSNAPVERMDTVWVELDRVWKVMPAVYTTVGLPLTDLNAETNTIGNSGHKLYRRLGEVLLTRYLDCGRTQVGQNAESYEVSLAVLTRLTKGDAGATWVATTVEASARSMQFSGNWVRCSSKGTLEARIAEVIKVQLQP